MISTHIASVVKWLCLFAGIAIAVAAGRALSIQIERIDAHEAAILALERNAEAMRTVLARHGWIVEGTK